MNGFLWHFLILIIYLSFFSAHFLYICLLPISQWYKWVPRFNVALKVAENDHWESFYEYFIIRYNVGVETNQGFNLGYFFAYNNEVRRLKNI